MFVLCAIYVEDWNSYVLNRLKRVPTCITRIRIGIFLSVIICGFVEPSEGVQKKEALFSDIWFYNIVIPLFKHVCRALPWFGRNDSNVRSLQNVSNITSWGEAKWVDVSHQNSTVAHLKQWFGDPVTKVTFWLWINHKPVAKAPTSDPWRWLSVE